MKSPMPENMTSIDMRSIYEKYPSLLAVESKMNSRLNQRKNIVDLIPEGTVGAEIGVFTGIFSEFISHISKPSKLYMVDGWHKLLGEKYPNWGDYTDNGNLTTEAAYEASAFRARNINGAEVCVSVSLEWLPSLPDQHLDWVYLDSSHSYDNTMKELMAISPKMKQDAIILGDDAWTHRSSQFYGVFQAVSDFCRIRPYELFRLDHAAQWAIRRQPNDTPTQRK